MADFEIPRPGPIKVIKKPPHLKVKIKLPDNKAPHPPDFDLFWMLADVYIVQEEYIEGYFIPEYQVDIFDEDNEVILLVSVPDYIFSHPTLLRDTLRLLYYDKGTSSWEKFVDLPPDLKLKSIQITIPSRWIKDPPLGWGGNVPNSNPITSADD